MNEKIQFMYLESFTIINRVKQFFFHTYGLMHGKRLLKKLSNANIEYFDILNRSSLKLAEIDRKFKIIPKNKNFKFFDLCSAPGGFLDYLILRKKNSLKGYALSKHYNEGGIKYSDNIRKCNNITKEYRDILKYEKDSCCYKKFVKVDLILADGADITTDIQNSRLLDRLIEAECKIILKIARKRTNVILKTFDFCISDSTAKNLINLINYFDSVTFFKPKFSRSGNAERYIILQNYNQYHYQFRRKINLTSDTLILRLMLADIIMNVRQTNYLINILNNSIKQESADKLLSDNLSYINKILKIPFKHIEYY